MGIVEKVEGGVIYTIEGNSGDVCRQNHTHWDIMRFWALASCKPVSIRNGLDLPVSAQTGSGTFEGSGKGRLLLLFPLFQPCPVFFPNLNVGLHGGAAGWYPSQAAPQGVQGLIQAAELLSSRL